MPKLPMISGQDCVKALQRGGFSISSQKGSHIKMRHADGLIVIVPNHSVLDRGTLRSIIRQAGLTVEEFLDLLQA